jgi:hypothetical protein
MTQYGMTTPESTLAGVCRYWLALLEDGRARPFVVGLEQSPKREAQTWPRAHILTVYASQ